MGSVTFAMVHWSNTSHVHYAETRPGKPTVVKNPVHADFRVARKEGALRVAAEFVNTAVRRRHLEVSYDLASPTLKQGYSRHAWATEDIPVQPYPLDSARYKVMGSFTDQVWVQVALYPDHKHKSVPAAVFDLTLKPFANGRRAPLARRLVDAGRLHGYPERDPRQRPRSARREQHRVQELAFARVAAHSDQRLPRRARVADHARRPRLVARQSGSQELPLALALTVR